METRASTAQPTMMQGKEGETYSVVMNPNYDLYSLCQSMSVLIANTIQAESVTIRLRDGESYRPIAWASVHGDPGEKVTSKCRLCQFVCTECKLFHDNFEGRAKPECADLETASGGGILVAPITNRFTVPIGVICVICGEHRRYSPIEIRSVESFAQHIAYEIDRRRMETLLIQSERLAALGRLLGEVAHEVRNPLNALLALNDAMDMEMGEDERYREFGPKITAQLERLVTLIRDLLDLGRDVTKRQLETVSVRKAVEDSLAYWRSATRYDKRCVEVEYAEDIGDRFIAIAPPKFDQIIYNGLDNACQHSQSDSPVILRVERCQSANVRFAVIDRGAGVPDEHRERVFEPFFTTRHAGTGLGLAVIKHVVELLGGEVSLGNNSDGPGAMLAIVLPLASDAVPACSTGACQLAK